MRMIYVLSLVFTAASLPQIAAAQSATLEPGLYDRSRGGSLAGNTLERQETEVCVREGENDKILEDLILGGNDDVECPASNVEWTASTVRTDFICEPDHSGFVVSGTMDAKYGADFLNSTMNGKLNGSVEIKTDFEMRRNGDCPEDWVNPKPLRLN